MFFFRYIRFVENLLYPVRWARSWLGRLFKFGGKGPVLTLAGKIATTTFIVFFLLWIFYLWRHWSGNVLYSPAQILGYSETPVLWFDFLIAFLLVILLTVFVYWTVRLASIEQDSLYPEIDQCWDAINSWRDERSFAWSEFSRYLVLGTDYTTSKHMHLDEAESKEEPLIPVGSEEWIHAFGNKRDMYIHLNETCNTSRRIGKLRSKGSSKKTGYYPTETLVADDPFGESLDAQGDDGQPQIAATEEVGPIGNFGTIDPNDDMGDPTSDSVEIPGSVENQKAMEDDAYEEDDLPSDRLEYFCKLILSRTDSEIPFGSVLVTIPFDVFNEDNYYAITDAVRKDLILLRRAVNLNFPVVFAFTSMETDNGFPKLQNLLGKQRSKSRFGAGCKPQSPPTLATENFELQVSRACRTFETWVFDRWSRNSQLSKAMQNKDLYKMVVRIRQGFKHRLRHLIQNSLLWKDSELPEGEQNELVLAGCYFVSTGNNPGSRGFLPGLFQKCTEFAQLSGWSDSALNMDRVYSVLASIFFLLSTAVVLFSLYLAFFSGN